MRNLLALTLVLAACTPYSLETLPADRLDPEEGSPYAPDEVVIHDDVVIVDDDPCVLDAVVPADREVLTFEFGCDPVGHGIEPGNIVVGTDHGGYLRRVESVAFDGWTVTAWTSPASIAEAVVQGGFGVTVGEDAERALVDFGNTVLFADEVMGSNVLVKLNRGSFDLTPLIDIDGHWAEGEMRRFDLDTSFSVEADLELYVSSSNGLRMSDELDVWETSFPFAAAIGPLPVAGRVGVRAKVGYRIDAPGQVSVTTGVSGSARWQNRREYRSGDGWEERPSDDLGWDVRAPDLDISSSVKVRGYLRFETFVTFYEVAGPELQADLYTQLEAEPECEGIEWDVRAGLAMRARIQVNILDKFKPTKIWGMVDLTADLADGVIEYPVGFPLPCAQPEIRCGDLVEGDTSTMTAQLDGYDCNVGNYAAPEAIYEYRADDSGSVEWALVDANPTEVNHDVMVLDGAMNLVFAQCREFGFNSVGFEAVSGNTYYLVVDGYNHDAGPFAARLSCD